MNVANSLRKIQWAHTSIILLHLRGLQVTFFIAVPGDRDNKPVRHFDTFTADLHAAAKWLKSCGIDSIAMKIADCCINLLLIITTMWHLILGDWVL